MSSTLYVVGTPIGNLGDISRRAIDILGSVRLIAAEDTRVMRKLMSYLGLSKPLVSYRAVGEPNRALRLISELEKGDVALVCDAGMPGVSDPGAEIVRLAQERGFRVCVVPGPSALTAAVAVSGFRYSSIYFTGFMPRSKKAILDLFNSVDGKSLIVSFESPRRVVRSLELLCEAGVKRPLVLARELTKIHEEIIRGTIMDVLQKIKAGEQRGEFTLVFGPIPERDV